MTIWIRSWRDLIRYQKVPHYRDLPWYRRLLLNALVLGDLFSTACFWRALYSIAVAYTLALIVSWHFDLSMRLFAAWQLALWLIVLPLLARARRLLLIQRFIRRQ